ncbi:U3 small nucleolar RNA-associated protein 20, partial [Cyphellophora attinorum]
MSRVSRKTKPTPSQNKHVFEPFSRRIARLKIDPIHTVKGRTPLDDGSDLSYSFFRVALDEWSSLNLTTTFTSFLRSVNGISETLPQLLHHADTVFNLLVQHIEKRDALALEPLLDLTAHFAHDLGQEFEQYFERLVTLIASVAAGSEASDVVEWSFTCLAWMFKYLARLLVQDLRPLLTIFRPYLTSRKEHVSRFSAESLAFLIRKAALLYPKNQVPLTTAISHLLESAVDQPSQVGVMTLLTESCLGVDVELHAGARHLVQCLLSNASSGKDQATAQTIVSGVLIGLIHESDGASFQPIAKQVLDLAKVATAGNDTDRINFSVSMLQVIVGGRKGIRVSAWKDIIATFIDLINAVNSNATEQTTQQRLLTSALILQNAPAGGLLPMVGSLLDASIKSLSATWFFTYCTMVASLGKERFQQFVLPHLQNFVTSNFSDDETALLFTLDQLRKQEAIVVEDGASNSLKSPKVWDESIASRLKDATSGTLPDAWFVGVSRLPHNVRLSTDRSTLFQCMKQRVIRQLRSGRLEDLKSHIIAGSFFESVVDLASDPSELADLFDELKGVLLQLWSLTPYLRAVNALLRRHPGTVNLFGSDQYQIQEVLVSNLLLRSTDVREESLILLNSIAQSSGDSWMVQVLANLLSILRTPYIPANARTISMLIRKLPQQQRASPKDSILELVIPNFCLGILSRYHDQARRDVCRALGEMIEDSALEDTIMDILVSWLITPAIKDLPKLKDVASPVTSSAFEDMSLLQARSAAEAICNQFEDPAGQLVADAELEHQIPKPGPPPQGRKLALDVLTEMVSLAEKRSKFVTPVFLDAQFTKSVHDATRSDSSTSSHTLSAEGSNEDWSLSERKAFITLFANFKNPRVLYRATEVYDKLFELLANGNVDIRKQALLTILKWKNAALQKHEEVLLKVVDEKIPSTEIGVILNAESEDNPVKTDERGDVLPVLLRLVYGLLVGRSGTHGSQESRRKTLLRMLFRMQPSEIASYLEIAIGKLQDVRLLQDGGLSIDALQHEVTTPDQRYGFLRMTLSTIQTLQTTFAPFGNQVIEAILYCTMRSSTILESLPEVSNSLERSTRRTGLECLTSLFEIRAEIEWTVYMPLIYSQLLIPRLESFANDNIQAVSVQLRLVAQWCSDPDFVSFLVSHDDRLLESLWQILSSTSTKPEVKVFILENMLLQLLGHVKEQHHGATIGILEQHQTTIVLALSNNLQAAPPADVLKSISTVLLEVAPHTKSNGSSESIIGLLIDLVISSKHRLTPAVKSKALAAINALLDAENSVSSGGVVNKLFNAISSLFDYFRDSANRLVLSKILQSLARTDRSIDLAAKLCFDLNSMSPDQLDEPDFDRRLRAFQRLATLEVDSGGLVTWRPVVYNLLFFCKDEDFNIRSNAVSALRSFIKRASGMDTLLKGIVLQSVQKGITHDSELVRADFVALFGLLVEHCEDPRLIALRPLLFGNDEEASFFANVLHIQQHRRLRAIRRLVSEVEKGTIDAQSVGQVFLPLLQKFIKDESLDESAQGMKGQSLAAMGTLLQWIRYSQFKVIFKQYKAELENEDHQKTAIKMLGQATDAVLQAWQDRNAAKEQLSHLATSLPEDALLTQDIKEQLYPKLADFVHFRDEAEMSARLPAAIIAIKLLKLLPVDQSQILSAPVVLDVANVLKSRTQESRDAARGVLIEIVGLLGPESVQFVLRQLRSVLQRGYQLHVLSYVVHAILVKMAPEAQLGDLDYCIEDLTAVIMDDTFGSAGQEKDNEDYISSMKEVKSKKSPDTMELLARSTSLDHLGQLIKPITVVLTGFLRTKQVRQVDELLRRIGVGLARNPAASERGLLVFAFQCIQAFYREKAVPRLAEKTTDEKNRERFLLQKPSARGEGTHSANLFKIARFAIDLVRSAFLKHNNLMTPENVHGFLPVIGDALVEGQEEVKISALRLASAVVKLRMPELNEKCPVFVLEAVKVVRNCTHTNEEAAQAALKLIAAILRERKSVKVRDSDVAEVLKRITPDLEEPDRQGVTFAFIRAVLARKPYQLPEVYEVVDKIAIIMVTSHSAGARDVARGVYVHFLVEYPQAAGRWSKQQRFLIKNLEYDYHEGRQAVMEAINTLLAKTSGEITQHLIAAFFIPIVLRMANDEHEGCRDLAGALLGQLFVRADVQRLQGMLEPLEGWLEQSENEALLKLSLQAFSVLFAQREGLEEQLVLCRMRIATILGSSSHETETLEARIQALRLWAVLVQTRPSSTMTSKSESIWKHIRTLLSFNIPERTLAASLVRSFLEACPAKLWSKLPLINSHGSAWDTTAMQLLLRSCVRIIKLNQGDQHLSDEVVTITTLIANSAPTNGLTISVKSEVDSTESASASDEDEDETPAQPTSIPATRYLLDQLAYVLRRELPKHTTATLFPKMTALQLLTTLVPTLPTTSLAQQQLTILLLPLLHLTSPTTNAPFSADPTFAASYNTLTTSAQEVMGLLQERVGDAAYMAALTAASKIARQRREERRRKRVVEQVADPERAARVKRIKGQRTKERKRE